MTKLNYIRNNYKQFPLQGKVFYLLLIIGTTFAFINSILNIILGLNIATVGTAIITTFICLLFLYAAFKTNNYIKIAQIAFLFLILFTYPMLWITNSGSSGPTPYFLIFNSIFMAIILDQKDLVKLIILKAMVIITLLYIEIIHPSWIFNYNTPLAKSLDLGLSVIFISIFTLILIRRLMKEYNTKINELNDAQSKLHKLSITDELTGIYNRRFIIQSIRNHIDSNLSTTLSLIMFDIDDFKIINDNHGHSTGDEVIKKISHLIQHHLDQTEVVGRIGGEEFLVLSTNSEDIRKKAECIRESILSIEWTIPNLVVTVSGGVYERNPHDNLDILLEKVDHYLYQAKAAGKNRIL